MAYTSFFTDIVNHYFPEPHASLLNGIIFGVNLKTDKEFILNLKKVGLTHLVVLSGMNITILASVITSLTKTFGKKASLMLTIFSIILFIIFVGVQAPIIRAGIMSILTFVAIITGRKAFTLYSLFLAAVVSLIFWPSWLSSISFQLSYGATLGLILFGSNQTSTPKKGFLANLQSYCITEFKTSMAAQIFTTPLIFLYFKQISLISPLSNVLVSWVVTPLMVFGFITVILGKINIILGLIPSYICYILLTYLIAVINLLSRVPFSFFQF